MPSTTTYTIDPGGGGAPNYVSLSAWQAAVSPRNLVTNDENIIINYFNGSIADDVAISGFTTDSTHGITIQPAVGAELSGGKSRDVTGTGARLVSTNTTVVALRIANAFVTVKGINVKSTGTGPYPPITYIFGTFASGNTCTIDSCVIQSAQTGSGYNVDASMTNLSLIFKNNVMYGGSARGLDVRNGQAPKLYFNTVQGGGDYGLVANAAATVINNYFGGFTTECYYTGDTAPTGSNNAATDASVSTDYSASQASLTAANEFTNLTGGSEDFSLKAGNHLVGNGIAAGSITVDIKGTTRPQGGTYDIGAFETVLGASAGEIIAAMTTQPSNQNLRPRVIGY